MKNFIQEGKNLDLIAPEGGVTSGVPLLIGTVLVVPAITAAQGDGYAGWIVGVYDLPCATGTAWETLATVLYWDNTNKRVTSTAGSNTKIGLAAAPKVAGAATGAVRLTPTA